MYYFVILLAIRVLVLKKKPTDVRDIDDKEEKKKT